MKLFLVFSLLFSFNSVFANSQELTDSVKQLDTNFSRRIIRTFDTSLIDFNSTSYNYKFRIPAQSKLNPIGTRENKEGKTEWFNYILKGGLGAMNIRYFTEQHLIPKDYKLLDSIHFFDSTGILLGNRKSFQRTFLLRDYTVQIEFQLTELGLTELQSKLSAIFDSFIPTPGSSNIMQSWRYGRDPKKYQKGQFGE